MMSSCERSATHAAAPWRGARVGALLGALMAAACAGTSIGANGSDAGVDRFVRPDGPITSGCSFVVDCDDHDPCTLDECDLVNQQCVHRTACCHGPADCDDGNACTEDACDNGICKHQKLESCCRAPADCDDGDPCTEDACDLANATCEHRDIPGCCTSDRGCDDGNPCTKDTCPGATCQRELVADCCLGPADCDDHNLCTTDACNTANHSCTRTAIVGCCTGPAACDDKNPCTTDACDANHQCTHTPVVGCCTGPAGCDDGDPCTTDTCNASNQCAHAPISDCQVCANPSVCDDHNACTGDACDGSGVCKHTTVPCDDGNACTIDTCDPTQGCQHAAVSCADDGDPCTTDECDRQIGCTHPAIPGCTPQPNDLCQNAIDVSQGSVFHGSTLGARHEVEPPASCVYDPDARRGADVFYSITLSAPEWVSFDTFGSSTDTVLYLLNKCGGNVLEDGSFCSDDTECAFPSSINSALLVYLEAGTWILVVDTYGSKPPGPFTLNVHRSGPNCASALPIEFDTPVTGDTKGGTTLLNASCGVDDESGPERMYVFGVCPAQSFSIVASTCGATADTVVSLHYGTCMKDATIACADDGCSDGFGSLLQALSIESGAGIYFVTVDTFSGKPAGPFPLTVKEL
jgi:hypothetical protein